MKAQLIAEQHIVGEPGRFEEQKHSVRHFLFVESGASRIHFPFMKNLPLYSFSVLPAMSLESGILHCDVVEGSFRTDSFALFIQNLLNYMEPFPGPNSVIVMDNCRIHKNSYIQEMIHARYAVIPQVSRSILTDI